VNKLTAADCCSSKFKVRTIVSWYAAHAFSFGSSFPLFGKVCIRNPKKKYFYNYFPDAKSTENTYSTVSHLLEIPGNPGNMPKYSGKFADGKLKSIHGKKIINSLNINWQYEILVVVVTCRLVGKQC